MDTGEYDDLVRFLKTGSEQFPPRLQSSVTKSDRNKRHYYKTKATQFFVKEDNLYRTTGNFDVLKVVRKGEEEALLHEFHSGKLGGHSGVNKTIDAIKIRYWWNGLTQDVKDYIKKCEKCQLNDPRVRRLDKKLEVKPQQRSHTSVSRPFELVGCDVMGPFKTTTNGNSYIFTATDYYTKWVEAFPIPIKSSEEVSKCLQKILYRHGAITSILTGYGKEFVNEINKQLCESWNVQHKMTAAFGQHTNGLDEKTNQTLKVALGKYVNEHKTDWDERIDEVLFSLRTKPQTTTKFSPFFLLYGREALYPSQLPNESSFDDGLPQCPSEQVITDGVARRQKVMETTNNAVTENVAKAKLRQQKVYEQKQAKKRKYSLLTQDYVYVYT